MITADEIRSRQKIRDVKQQILDERGQPVEHLAVIDCPYCGIKNYEGMELCCELLRGCVITILMGLRQEKIEERVSVH